MLTDVQRRVYRDARSDVQAGRDVKLPTTPQWETHRKKRRNLSKRLSKVSGDEFKVRSASWVQQNIL